MFDAAVLQEAVKESPYKILSKAINRSQHTQRNYDRMKKIPQKDIDQMLHSITESPSKQNIAYYKVHMIHNPSMIDALYECTKGFNYLNTKTDEWETEGNTQVLANMMIVFEKLPIDIKLFDNEPKGFTPPNGYRNSQHYELANTGKLDPIPKQNLEDDQMTAIGIAAGYLNLTAAILGYRTGCCACFMPSMVKETLNLEGEPALLMGVGFKQEGVNRRQHPTRDDMMFYSMKKQPIPVSVID